MNDELGGMEDKANNVKNILENLNATNFDQLKANLTKSLNIDAVTKKYDKAFGKTVKNLKEGLRAGLKDSVKENEVTQEAY